MDRIRMVNARTGREVTVPNIPSAIARNQALGYEVDTDPPAKFFRPQLAWRFDPDMPRVPRVATRFRGSRP
jgi:hypothetical protein